MEFRLLSLYTQAICLHPNMTVLQMISLDYAIAIYNLTLAIYSFDLCICYNSRSICNSPAALEASNVDDAQNQL